MTLGPATTLSALTKRRRPWVEYVQQLAVGHADMLDTGYPFSWVYDNHMRLSAEKAAELWEQGDSVWTGSVFDAEEMLKAEIRRRRAYQAETLRLMVSAAESVLARGGERFTAAQAIAAVASKRDPSPSLVDMETALQRGAWRSKAVNRVRG